MTDDYQTNLINNFFGGWFSAMDGTIQSRASLFLAENKNVDPLVSIIRGVSKESTSDIEILSDFVSSFRSYLNDTEESDVSFILTLSFYEIDDTFMDNPTVTYKWNIEDGTANPNYDKNSEEDHFGWILDPNFGPNSENESQGYAEDTQESRTSVITYEDSLKNYWQSITQVSADDIIRATLEDLSVADAFIQRIVEKTGSDIGIVDVEPTDQDGEPIPFIRTSYRNQDGKKTEFERMTCMGNRILVLNSEENNNSSYDASGAISWLSGLLHRSRTEYYKENVASTRIEFLTFKDDDHNLNFSQKGYIWEVKEGKILPLSPSGTEYDEMFVPGWEITV